jgi:hypothetical protein
MSDDHILPGAFGDEPKTVPLVIYEKDGKRRVVGEATLSQDENGLHIEGNVTDPEAKKIISQTIDGFSFTRDPKEAKDGR